VTELLAWQGLELHYPQRSEPLRFADGLLSHGEHLVLRGPSGSGKSSLIALLAGLRRANAGDVRLAGRSLAALSNPAIDAWRGEVLGVLPQRLHLVEGLSVRENLELPWLAVGRPADGARVAALCERLGLAGLLQRLPSQLSVGQMQRVALARALARAPRLLLLDEPSSSLDDAATEALLRLARELAQEQGVSLLVATHDARVTQGLADLPGLRTLQLELTC